jgi:hypothetical protein
MVVLIYCAVLDKSVWNAQLLEDLSVRTCRQLTRIRLLMKDAIAEGEREPEIIFARNAGRKEVLLLIDTLFLGLAWLG